MDELDTRIIELFTGRGCSRQNCSQAIMTLALELCGEENPGLIKALGGLGTGLFCNKTCGTLMGGACVIAALYPGEGTGTTLECGPLVRQLTEWFEARFGTLECSVLLAGGPMTKLTVCPALIRETFLKCLELLAEAGIDPVEQGMS